MADPIEALSRCGNMHFVKAISNRMQFALVGLGYAAVLAVSTALLFRRQLLELQDPVTFSGGMAAAGDTMLYFFIGCLFLIPTAFLIWVISKFEVFYTAYSQFLLGLSLSAPICLTVLVFDSNHVAESIGWISGFRVLGSPIVLVGMGISRYVARFDRAKRFATYALLVEGVTICLMVAALTGVIFMHR